ncbi:hypothetical protein HY932_00540 [Candidatus Falkowbacteria bacterium]|nr:hypothetical protein [Candidatus Falkowbacteria bacterium]
MFSAEKLTKLVNFLKPKNKKVFWIFLVFILLSNVILAQTSYASVPGTVMNTVLTILNWLLNIINGLLSWILTKLFGLILTISAYNDFFSLPSVEKGWIIVRDLCNMMFVVVLLVIAFANIFGRESYAIKKTLPKLVFAAVAVNFSKLICGLIIDFGQVIMLTFVNGYKAVSAFNLVTGLRLTEYLTPMTAATGGEEVTFNIFLSQGLGFLLLIASIGAMALLLGLLLVRIVYIWFLVIFSPIAFAFEVLPITQTYAKKWWDTFTKYVFVGPLVAFFLWLSLYTMATLSTGESTIMSSATQAELEKYDKEIESKSGAKSGQSKVSINQNLATVAIAIAMLYGSFGAAAWAGGMAGKMGLAIKNKVTGAMMVASGATLAKKFTDWRNIKKYGAKAGKAIGRPVWGVMKKPIVAGFKGVTAIPRAPIATIKSAWQKGAAAVRNVKGAGGGLPKQIAAGALGALIGGFAVMKQSAVDGWRTSGLAEKTEKYKDEKKKVDDKLGTYKDGNLRPDALRDIMNNVAASFAERIAATMVLAEKKELNKDDRATVQELKKDAESSLLHKNPVIAPSLKDSVAKVGAAHIYYDLSDSKQREDLAKDFKKGKIKYDDQNKEAHEDAEFDKIAYESLNIDRYTKAKEKAAERSVDDEASVLKSLEAARERKDKDGKEVPAGDIDKICAAIFKMKGDLQQTFTYNGALQMDKMSYFIRAMNANKIDQFDARKLPITPGAVTAKSPIVSVVQNVNFDSLTKATNVEVKERIVEAAFNTDVVAEITKAGTAAAARLEEFQERIFKSTELNQLVPDAARAKVQKRVDAKEAAKEAAKQGGGGGKK